jgi:uncharacterized protein DUF4157
MGDGMRFHQAVRPQRAGRARAASAAPPTPAAAAARSPIPSLQQSIGNRAVGRLVHARLEVGRSGHRLARAMNPATADNRARTTASAADRARANHERGRSAIERERLAWAESGVRGVGQPLPAGPRALLEAQLASGFGDVRLHSGPGAAAAARQLGAAAYALGTEIAFGHGFYRPDTRCGLRLLAHELAHVVHSRGVPASPLQASDSAALLPLEREAERASEAFGGSPVAVRQRLAGRMPLCHPVYISAHGDKAYLDMAAKFYTNWGYAPVQTGVSSIEAVLRDLAGQSSIGQVTIVSHANPQLMQIQFIDGGPDVVEKSDWQVDTGPELLTLDRHLVPTAMVDEVIARVKKASPYVLPRIGPVGDPIVRQFIWWVVDEVYAEYQGFPVPQAVRLKKFAQVRTAVYRSSLLSAYQSSLLSPPTERQGRGSAQPAVTSTDLAVAELAVRTQALQWPWPKPGTPPRQPLSAEQERRLKESPSAAVLRILQNPDFLANLSLVRNKISDASYIEVQGCNAGADRSYLEAIQRFFGGGAKKPKVTAPDWFQAFGPYGLHYIPNTPKAALTQWRTPEVRAALTYWYPIITGNPLPKEPTALTLLAYLRKGHALPLAIPSAPGEARILVLSTIAESAFIAWLSRHSYRLTSNKEIKDALFTGKDLGANVERAVVDMLEEGLGTPTRFIFRAQKAEYDKHIIEVH